MVKLNSEGTRHHLYSYTLVSNLPVGFFFSDGCTRSSHLAMKEHNPWCYWCSKIYFLFIVYSLIHCSLLKSSQLIPFFNLLFNYLSYKLLSISKSCWSVGILFYWVNAEKTLGFIQVVYWLIVCERQLMKTYWSNCYWHYLFTVLCFCTFIYTEQFSSSISLSLSFFFTAVFIKIGFLFLLFILIDWFYGWRKSLTFKPVNPSITEIIWLIWNIQTSVQST